MLTQTSEQEQTSVLAANLVFQHIKRCAKTQGLNLIVQQPMHRILNRLLHLTPAKDAQRLLCRHENQSAGKGP